MALFDMQRSCGDEIDAVQAEAAALDIEAAYSHRVGSGSIDDDAVAGSGQDAAGSGLARDGERLLDRHHAEAAAVEAIDLAFRRGLRDRTGEGLARRGAAA